MYGTEAVINQNTKNRIRNRKTPESKDQKFHSLFLNSKDSIEIQGHKTLNILGTLITSENFEFSYHNIT